MYDCSPIEWERELGLDRRVTGWFYPTVTIVMIIIYKIINNIN